MPSIMEVQTTTLVACSVFSESRREELKRRSLLSVYQHFSTTIKVESGDAEQALCSASNECGSLITPSTRSPDLGQRSILFFIPILVAIRAQIATRHRFIFRKKRPHLCKARVSDLHAGLNKRIFGNFC